MKYLSQLDKYRAIIVDDIGYIKPDIYPVGLDIPRQHDDRCCNRSNYTPCTIIEIDRKKFDFQSVKLVVAISVKLIDEMNVPIRHRNVH